MLTQRHTLAGMFCIAWLAASAAVPAAANENRTQKLDRLYAALGEAPDEAAARRIENDIWQTWIDHDDPRVKAMIDEAMQRRRWHDLEGALVILDELVKIAPGYAEAWNQRANVHFLLQNYEQSLFDVAEVLQLEPRHFAALAGRGLIRFQQGKPALAYQNILAAMQIHPYIRERDLLPDFIREGDGTTPAE